MTDRRWSHTDIARSEQALVNVGNTKRDIVEAMKTKIIETNVLQHGKIFGFYRKSFVTLQNKHLSFLQR